MFQICFTARSKFQSWYLKNGCTQHVTGERHMFHTLTLKEGGIMRFGGNQKGKIVDIDIIGNSSISISNV